MSSGVPLYCPFCAEEDLRPAEAHGAWHCRACTRTFSVRRLVGAAAAGGGPAAAGSAP